MPATYRPMPWRWRRAMSHDYGLEQRISLIQSDGFAELGGRRYDLILANPPYVSEVAVAAFPPEYAAEPVIAHAGGADGLDIVRRILAEAGRHLTETGTLVVEIGTGRAILEEEYSDLPFAVAGYGRERGRGIRAQRRRPALTGPLPELAVSSAGRSC